MPINNRYNIKELMEACKYYINKTNKRISFEYALAKDNNDNLDDAKELVKLLKGMLCHVNLIPINKIENGNYVKSTNENIIKFRDFLNKNGIVATIRRELGSDIDAACGTIKTKKLKRRINERLGLIMVFAKTDIGKVREINQDYYYTSEENSIPKLYILADGMGGYKGGEVASKLAVDSARKYIENNFSNNFSQKEEILKLIGDAVEYANMVVYEKSKEVQELEGMGTTLEICLIYNNKAYIGHIGDSRIYRIRKDVIRKLTKDHSYVQQLVEDKKITREEAKVHPKKNMLTRALGCTPYVEPDLRARNFEKGDIFIMCSDGLTNMVEEKEYMN